MKIGPQTFPCALGRSGSNWKKQEGDGITPLLHCKTLWGFYRPDKGPKPISSIPFRPLSPQNGWCDEKGHARYNLPVPHPFPASHEKMWRDDHLYDIGLVLDYNISHRIQGKGSAIFLHLARPNYTPTEGCIAVSHKTMTQLLAQITPSTLFHLRR